MLDLLSVPDGPNPFGVELSGVRLEADDMEWSLGEGEVVSGPGQALVAVSERTVTCPWASARRHRRRQFGLNGSMSWRAMRPAAPERAPACSTGTGRPVRPVAQGVLPRRGRWAVPARWSHTVSTTPRLTP